MKSSALCCAKKGDFEAAAHYADFHYTTKSLRTAIYSKLNTILEQPGHRRLYDCSKIVI